MDIAIYTLGCKVNQYETQAMERELLRRGHTLVPFEDLADAYIINTCTVTAVSDKKCRNVIRRAKKMNPQAVVAVCGCYAQTEPEAVAALGVDLVSGTAGRMEFLDLLEGQLKNHAAPIVQVDESLRRRDFERLTAGGQVGRTRAMLKVEDGCTNFCTYCIIPYARGPVRSLPLSEAVDQAKELEAQGYREIVLTGIEISSWGRDLKEGQTLIDLVEALCHAVPGLRVRLGSLEPRTITQDFCQRAVALPNLCPHFHLSMQSGCDETLKRMNRKYDTARYLQSVQWLNQYFDRPAITTDLIVGFPGETEEEFEQSLHFIKECGFASMHIFPYSKRPGTPAAKMEGQILNAVKEQRAHRASEVANDMEKAFLKQFVGQREQVLFEELRDGMWRGYTTRYCEVRLESQENLHNVLCEVELIAQVDSHLIGRL